MAANRNNRSKDIDATASSKSDPHFTIDPGAPAGSKNSLGAESVRDEEGPDITAPHTAGKIRPNR